VGVFLLSIVSILLFGFLVQAGASADPADAGAVSEQFENSGRNDGARAPAGAIAETAGDEAVGGAGGQESVAEDSDDQPAPTVTLPAEAEPAHNRLILFYNPAGFYAFNAGSRDIDVRPLSFVAIRDDGEHSEFRFDGVRWAGFFARIQPGKCDRLEIINASPRERPAQCRGYNALLTPEPVDRMNFWLARDGISDFRVTYGEQEVQLCQIAAGQCEVLLP
jgi:hypothetical protein